MKIKKIERKHQNDCWCNAIRLALNVKYETVYKDFEKFRSKDGGAYLGVIGAYLSNKGYARIEVDISLDLALKVYTQEGAIFSMVEKQDDDYYHMIYVKHKTIYDSIVEDELESYLKRYKVTEVFIKE